MSSFQTPMRPFPGLERWSRRVSLPSSGMNLFLYDTGSGGPVVLLLHGLGDEADTWRHVIPALTAAGCRVIAPDLPGFGRSDQGKRPYTIPFFATTIFELLDVLSLSRVVLAGHSAGAIIAQAMALDHPQRVERLVLISGSLLAQENRIDPGLLLFLTPLVGEWMYNRLRKDPQAAYQTLAPYYNRLDALPQTDRDFLYQRVNERVWSDGQRRGFLSTLRGLVKWLPAQQKGLPVRLQNWTIPTVVVWGENDRINAAANAHAFARLLPAARLVLVPDAGHNIHQEKPQIVTESILR